MEQSWKALASSVIGTAHIRAAIPCQDATGCIEVSGPQSGPVLIAIASDGAGSAVHAEVGSHLACRLLQRDITAHFVAGGRMHEISHEWITNWLARYQHDVGRLASLETLSPRDFACTILVAVVGRESAVFVQLGDGAIVIAAADEPDEYCWVFWPQKGEYENQTVFITNANAADNLMMEFVQRPIDEVSLFTDGLERLALHFPTQSTHNPFFRPIFAALRSTNSKDLVSLASGLKGFLNSPQVTDRTDDDKSLIIASRYLVKNEVKAGIAVNADVDTSTH